MLPEDVVKISTRLETQGKTCVLLGLIPSTSSDAQPQQQGLRVVGIMAVQDTIKAEAASTVGALQNLGLDVWIITGDNETAAHAVALQVILAPRSSLVHASGHTHTL